MLANFWVVLAFGDGMKCAMVVQECCETMPMPQTRLDQACVTMAWLAFTSTNHSSSASGFLIFGLCWKTCQFLRRSTTGWIIWKVLWCHESVCESVQIISWIHHQVWVRTMFKLFSTSMQHSSSTSGSLRFGLCWLARHLPGGFLHMLMAWKVLWCYESVLKLYYINSLSGKGKNNV